MVERTLGQRGYKLFSNTEEVLLLNTVPTDDEERAVKITNELRTKLIALDQWHAEGNLPFLGFGKVLREEAI